MVMGLEEIVTYLSLCAIGAETLQEIVFQVLRSGFSAADQVSLNTIRYFMELKVFSIKYVGIGKDLSAGYLSHT